MFASLTATWGGKNLFGICAAIGEDMGFNPLWLRIALAISLLFQPVAVLSAYALLGITVAVSRLLYPNRGRHTTTAELQAA